MIDVAAFRQAVSNHVGNGADPNADVQANAQLVAQEANAVNIPDKLRMVANDVASEGTASEIARMAAVLQAVGMHAPTDSREQDPMRLSALPTPNAPAKGGQEMALA